MQPVSRPSNTPRGIQRPSPALLAIAILLAALPPPADAAPDRAAFRAHIKALETGPLKEFQVARVDPFVVLCDEENDAIREKWLDMVSWAVDRLKKDFFATDPDAIVDIWLCRDAHSYKRTAWTMFRDEPTSPFGYYTPRHRAIVINMSTGSGTLVHEIVHPYIAANFPRCPTWFNEGLASLFEHCMDSRGHIRGLVNWRLPGLQDAIRRKALPSFEAMMALSPTDFYASDARDADYSQHYAQARYLCYYLQKNNLLTAYYREFVASIDSDPTGCLTLQRILKTSDLAGFQARWEAFILSLHE